MVGSTPDQGRVVGVVSHTTRYGDYIVNCRQGKVSLNKEIAQTADGDFVHEGDVISFVYSKLDRQKVLPSGEPGFIGKVFNYEKIDASTVGLHTEIVMLAQGTVRKVRVQCSVTYSHTNSEGVCVFKNDVLGEVLDQDKHISENCRGEQFEVKVQWCFLQRSTDGPSPSAWVIIQMNNKNSYRGNGGNNKQDRPHFGFAFFHNRKRKSMVWTLNSLPQKDYHILIPTALLERTSEYFMGKWVDVYCKKDAPYIAERIIVRNDTETWKEGGNKHMAALVCTFKGALTDDRDYLLYNDLVGDVVCGANLDWKPGQTRKMWCYLECEPVVHWATLCIFDDHAADDSNSAARKERVPSIADSEPIERNVRAPASSDVRIQNGTLKTNGYRNDSTEDPRMASVGSIPPRDSAYYSVNGDERQRNTHGVMEAQGYMPGRSDDEMLSMDGMSLAEERSPAHYVPRSGRNGGRRRSFSSLDPFENSDSVTLSSETRAAEKLSAQTHWMKRLLQYEEVKNVAQKCDQEAYVKLLETLSGVR